LTTIIAEEEEVEAVVVVAGAMAGVIGAIGTTIATIIIASAALATATRPCWSHRDNC